ncbi:hypothetical protein [Ectothiorhodospira magna]|nr:hypothetical protein [Ectothiorhodospira magna]
MLRKILLTLSVAIPFFGLALLLTGAPPRIHYDDLPWEVTVHDDGTASVFGIHLEQTPLTDLQARFVVQPELTVVGYQEASPAVLADFGPVKLGPFEAMFLAVSAVDDTPPAQWWQDAKGAEGTLSATQAQIAQALPVTEIIYEPRARYDDASVLGRFGEPHDEVAMDDGRRYWLYPQQGLVLMFNPQGRDVLHYVAPARFEAVVTAILTGQHPARPQP